MEDALRHARLNAERGFDGRRPHERPLCPEAALGRKNVGIIRTIVAKLEGPVLFPEDPQIVAAWGAP
jgi:hypothetical protein